MVQYLKKIFRTEKIKKKIMTSFIVVIVLMSIGTTLGAITLSIRQGSIMQHWKTMDLHRAISEKQ